MTEHPPERRNGPPKRAAADTTTMQSHPNGCRVQVRLDCGCTRWCRCEYKANPTGKRVDAYAAAARHLDALNLPAAPLIPEMRALWRRGDRALVQRISSRWEVAG